MFSCIFRVVSILITRVHNKMFSTCNKFFCQGERSLGTVSELFKHAHVHLKRLRKSWLWWEQYFVQSGQIIPTVLFFHSYWARTSP